MQRQNKHGGQRKQNKLNPAKYPSAAEFASIIAGCDAGALYPTVKKLYTEFGGQGIRVNHDEEQQLIHVLPFMRSPVPSYIFKYVAGSLPKLVAMHPPAPQQYNGEQSAALKKALAANSNAIVAEDGVVVTIYWLSSDDEKAVDMLQIATNKSIRVNKHTRFRTGAENSYEAALRRACAATAVDIDQLDHACCHTICFRDPSFNPCANQSRVWHIASVDVALFNDELPMNRNTELKEGRAPEMPRQPTMKITYEDAVRTARSNGDDSYGLLVPMKDGGAMFVESTRMCYIRQMFYGDFIDKIDRDADRILHIATRACLSAQERRGIFEQIAPRIAGIVFPHVEAAITGLVADLCGARDVAESTIASMAAIVAEFDEPALRRLIDVNPQEKTLATYLHNIKFTDVMYLRAARTMEASGIVVGAF